MISGIRKANGPTDLLVLPVPGPTVRRPLLLHYSDIDEARLGELLWMMNNAVQAPPGAMEGLIHKDGPAV